MRAIFNLITRYLVLVGVIAVIIGVGITKLGKIVADFGSLKRLFNGALWFFIFGLVVIGAIGLGLYELAKWLSEEAFDCMIEVSND